VVGKNDGWKQAIGLGKRTNQNVVFVPHARFIEMLTYKAELVGIQVQITEERYTSQASFLDGDPLPVYDAANPTPIFRGRRVKRGLYRAANGRRLNADVNGAYNILRKVVPNAFGNGIGVWEFTPSGLPWRMGRMAPISMLPRTISTHSFTSEIPGPVLHACPSALTCASSW
jgi:transposase